MVKLPGLDDLKKMGSDLIDTAKSVKMGEVVDKLKSGMESVGIKKTTKIPEGEGALTETFQELHAALDEFADSQAKQATTIKKIRHCLAELAQQIEHDKKSAVAEERKKHET